mmetsp:Transcript_29861/g.65286  ORF Transcript_29861/g.65286 Transcript_29861/m.65286 type:complete len:99 (-) Transcript_29861:404-700(-)
MARLATDVSLFSSIVLRSLRTIVPLCKTLASQVFRFPLLQAALLRSTSSVSVLGLNRGVGMLVLVAESESLDGEGKENERWGEWQLSTLHAGAWPVTT